MAGSELSIRGRPLPRACSLRTERAPTERRDVSRLWSIPAVIGAMSAAIPRHKRNPWGNPTLNGTPSLTLAPPERAGLLHGLTAQPSPHRRARGSRADSAGPGGAGPARRLRPAWSTRSARKSPRCCGGRVSDRADKPLSARGVHFVNQNLDAEAGGAALAAPLRFRQGRADDGQVVGVVPDLVGGQSETPGLRFPAASSQPRAFAQSMQMQVPDPSTTTGAT